MCGYVQFIQYVIFSSVFVSTLWGSKTKLQCWSGNCWEDAMPRARECSYFLLLMLLYFVKNKVVIIFMVSRVLSEIGHYSYFMNVFNYVRIFSHIFCGAGNPTAYNLNKNQILFNWFCSMTSNIIAEKLKMHSKYPKT